jgi:hypothetical protein
MNISRFLKYESLDVILTASRRLGPLAAGEDLLKLVFEKHFY